MATGLSGRRSSLRSLLLTLFVLPLVIVAGMTGYLSHRNSIHTVDEIAAQLCREIMNRVEQHVDSYLQEALYIIQGNLRLASHGHLDLDDPENLAHYFWEQGQLFRGLGTIAFAGSDGSFVGANEPENYMVIADPAMTGRAIRRYTPTADGYISDTILREVADYDARQREWFRNAFKAGRPGWAGINASVTGVRLDLTAAAPYFDRQGRFKGIFLTDVSLANISNFLRQLQIGKSGRAYIIDQDWKIIGSSAAEPPFSLLDDTSGAVERLSAFDSGSSLIASSARELAENITNLGSLNKERHMVFHVGRHKYYMELAPFRRNDLQLLAVIVVPEADFLSHVRENTRMTLLMICVVLIGTLILGVWFSGWVVQPLRRLAHSARLLGKGELEGEIEIERRDEVGELAASFKEMAGQLQGSLQDLRQEVEARKNTENALLETLNRAEDEKEKTRAMISAIGDGVSIHDTDFKVLFQNDIHKGMVGDHQGEYCYAAYEHRNAVCDGCPVADSFRDGMIHRAERVVDFPEGRRTFDITASPIRDSSGVIIAGIEVVRETTERRDMEEALAEEKERLAVTLRSIGDGVITYNLDGRVVLVNKRAEQLTGWPQDEAAGRPIGEVFTILNRETREPMGRFFQEMLNAGSSVNLPANMTLVARDGSERIVADSAAPIRDRESQVVGIVLVFRDVTHELRTEEELLKVKKLEAVGILAGGIAHDFNNILVAILGNLNLAMQMLDKKSQVYPVLDEASRASIRAKDLTNQLLTFAKGGNPVKELSSIGEVIRDSAGFVLHGGTVACTFNIPGDLWLADVDRGQISQVVQNLIINARHAMPEGGTIKVSCNNITEPERENIPLEQDKHYIRIMISDTGIGIPEKLIDRIFDPYFTTKTEGSGLGLAICHSIISKHNGHVSVWSRYGKGTTFSIYLPACPEGVLPQDREAAEDELAGGDGQRVLLMDDDEMVRQVAGNMLEFMGYRVDFADEGHQAVEMYRIAREGGDPYDAVIMDLTIPGGMGGQEAVAHILAFDRDARVIVSSGYSNDPTLANYRDYGFRAAVVKPFQMKDLQSVINAVLG